MLRAGREPFGSDGLRTAALFIYFDAFSSREPKATSLENALKGRSIADHASNTA